MTIKQALKLVKQIIEEAESREDVLDGPNGLVPDKWMRVAMLAREALAALRLLPGPATEEEMQERLTGMGVFGNPNLSPREQGFRAGEHFTRRRILGE